MHSSRAAFSSLHTQQGYGLHLRGGVRGLWLVDYDFDFDFDSEGEKRKRGRVMESAGGIREGVEK